MATDLDLMNIGDRQRLVEQIKSSENTQRRAMSLKQTEIYNDRILQHVWEKIARRFSVDSARRMPIVSSINLARRIVKAEASIYKQHPEREYTDLTPQQEEAIELIYKDGSADSKMLRSNESFKLQNQNHVMLVPKGGKLVWRVLRNHHVDKIDDTTDPETAHGYVISSMEKDMLLENHKRDTDTNSGYRGRFDQYLDNNSDRTNENIGDPEDYKTAANRFVVWARPDNDRGYPALNFIMNERGEVLSGDTLEEMAALHEFTDRDLLPIIYISEE